MKRTKTIRDRIFKVIAEDPKITLDGIVEFTRLKKSQIQSAIKALQKSDSFPADSPWSKMPAGNIKQRVFQTIFTYPQIHMDKLLKTTGLRKSQVDGALKQLRAENVFPPDSKWAESRPTTQDEILMIAKIGVPRVKEIIQLLEKLDKV